MRPSRRRKERIEMTMAIHWIEFCVKVAGAIVTIVLLGAGLAWFSLGILAGLAELRRRQQQRKWEEMSEQLRQEMLDELEERRIG
jgi:hypothetical protein